MESVSLAPLCRSW